ncbi:hypothetical protein E8E12_000965 [Didymella heteroderae]|uniref:Uncharacterized protein n=1 Tax=Didymella heteroderae TaxID=1769908 RepID=A0A9P4WFS7_9PLEO|nr:hypothetical protein E8E12_000965 [Didymella heteroderae]
MTLGRDAKPGEPGKCLMCRRPLENEDYKPSKAPRTAGAVDIDATVVDELGQLPPVSDPLPKRHPRFEHSLPPEDPRYNGDRSIFLAGSIEMGKAVQWQRQMAAELQDLPVTVCDPRRGHWDPRVTQLAGDPAFKTQVVWELSALEKADIICFFLDANTISPVAMMEFGLWASSGRVIVCCDSRFWRAGNVHLVCERYNVPYVEKFDDLKDAIRERFVEIGVKAEEDDATTD